MKRPPTDGPASTWVTLDSAGAAEPPRVGLELPARYEDRGLLGAGAIGQVRRVYDRVLCATLAMKILQHAPHLQTRTRFFAEARVTARLRHPGIVAVQDLGELPDGRPWFTMEEVNGRTFAEILRESGGLRRKVEMYLRVCEAVAYAHAQGVVHRDLKPENVMIGAFGEVRVMDWGLARVRDAVDVPVDGAVQAHDGTMFGSVLGTPGYMPPEQAAGRSRDVGPPSDVYALGAILYTLLAGQRPYAHLGGREVLAATVRGPPRALAELAADAPPPLVELSTRAMARTPAERPADAGALVEVVRDWLEGARKEAEARTLVQHALLLRPEVDRLQADATSLGAQAAALLQDVAAYEPVERKLPGWRLEEEAARVRAEALEIEEGMHRDLRAALGHAPELAEAHLALADLYRSRLERAEALGERLAAADAEALLRSHDRGVHRRWLDGQGAVTLVTDPPGATVELFRFVEHDRRLVEQFERTLGVTPLFEVVIPRGSWMLRVHHPGRAPVRYPVFLGRLEHWDGVRPGGDGPHPIGLPPTLSEDERYVPAGWFRSGGDPDALDGLAARRLWVDGLVVKRDPVTNLEYQRYLDALLREGGDVDAAVPRGLMEAEALFVRVGDRFELGSSELKPLREREPVVFLTAAQADAYVAWRARTDGCAWRLPHDQEWEKAARGVDGRIYPWGDRFEPTWTRMQSSLRGEPGRADVDEIPADVGPYGLVGAAGNTRDICHNAYLRGGLPAGTPVVLADPAPPDAPFRMLRGGSWSGTERQCRLTTRVVLRPNVGLSVAGLRLFRSEEGRCPPNCTPHTHSGHSNSRGRST